MTKKIKTSIGGQAVMEGVMMRGPKKWALAVRKPDGTVDVESHDVGPAGKWSKIPVVRGVYSFISSLAMGYNTLSRSAELAFTEEELDADQSKFDKWIEKKFGDKAAGVIMTVAAVLGVGLALVLFMVLPTLLVGLLGNFIDLGYWRALLEGVIKIVIFVAYLALVRKSKDITRVFGYHGAEHKTIFCYESGEALTVENVRKQKRFHPRCGTSFLLIVMIISILAFSIVPWTGTLIRVGLKILMLPVVMGLSYEVIRFAGRHDNVFTRVISAPGMWLQHLTTNEPDDSMIEVAIAAVLPVIPEDTDEAKW